MKFHLHTPTGTLELEAASQKELFSQIAETQEIFGETHCGLCKGEALRFIVRKVDDYTYHEQLCTTCGAKLAFGVNKKNPELLYPKRRLEEDGQPAKPGSKTAKYDPKHRGWSKFRGVVKDDE